MKRKYLHADLAPSLTGKERVALVRVMEEAAELQKEAAKALRFGLANRYPKRGPTNAQKMVAEFSDIEAALIDLNLPGMI